MSDPIKDAIVASGNAHREAESLLLSYFLDEISEDLLMRKISLLKSVWKENRKIVATASYKPNPTSKERA